MTKGPQGDKRRAAEKAGRRAETIAATYLRMKGYKILEMRYKTPVGEVDLIAKKGGALVFTEIKHRQARRPADELVGPRQRQRIERAALAFLARHPHLAQAAMRFDIILLGDGLPRHLTDAWRPKS